MKQSFNISKNTALLTLVIGILTFSCLPERDNPWDEGTDPNVWAPKNFNIQDLSLVSKKLAWEHNGDERIEGFRLDRKVGNQEWQVGAMEFPKETREWTDIELLLDTTLSYSYRIYCFAGEHSSADASVEIQISFPYPTEVAIQKLSDIRYSITWNYTINGHQGFKIDRRVNNGEWKQAHAIVSASAREYIDTCVFSEKSEVPVEYRIYAYYNSINSGKRYINTNASITPPTNLQININSPTSVTLSWDHTSTGHQGFKIDKKINDDEWQTGFATISPTERSYTDNSVDLSSLQTYSYRLYSYYNSYNSSYIENSVGSITITTADISNITENSATSGGTITNVSGLSIANRGVCWSESPQPTIDNQHTNDGASTGTFVSNITGLEPGRTYYVRAFVTSSINTIYGNERTFNTNASMPTVTTSNPSNIGTTTALCGGTVTNSGGSDVTARGVCWATYQNPTLSNSYTTDGTGLGNFTSSLTGLVGGTTYYVRAYATNSMGTAYGTQLSFTTGLNPVIINTLPISDVTQNSAISGGNITDDGGSAITARGVCYGLNPNPTTNDNHTYQGTGSGIYESQISGLSSSTTYYVRAFASNTGGTYYGQELSFTTTAALPSLATTDIMNVTNSSATCGGYISDQGDAPVTARGVCWSTQPNPTIDDDTTLNGSGIGQYTSQITGLTNLTTYYVRAYATSAVGTGYGQEVSFMTRYNIGSDYQGGKILYIYQSGDPGYVEGEFHGIIVANSNAGSAAWGCQDVTIGNTVWDLGAGAANTQNIVTGCPTEGIAARVCLDLELDGYNDWYLPSRLEMFKVLENYQLFVDVGGDFWTSSERTSSTAWGLRIPSGNLLIAQKIVVYAIRPVRYF